MPELARFAHHDERREDRTKKLRKHVEETLEQVDVARDHCSDGDGGGDVASRDVGDRKNCKE